MIDTNQNAGPWHASDLTHAGPHNMSLNADQNTYKSISPRLDESQK